MSPVKPIILVALCCFCLPLLAKTGDREQPIQIEADSLEIDESRHISVYQGKVTMQQGSLKIKGDSISLHFDENNDLQWLEIHGSPAHFSQLNDRRQTISGSALTIHYYANDSLMEMQGQARYQTQKDVIESEFIRINIQTDALQAGDEQGKGRVRMLIQPKPAGQ